LSSNVVTMTTVAAHGLIAGQTIQITGFTNPVFNGRYSVLATPAPTATTFAYARTNANIAATVSVGSITTFPQGTLTFTLNVINPVDMPITVNVNYTDIGGVLGAVGQTYSMTVPIAAGTDYDNGQDQAMFPAISTGPQTVSVAINPDFIVEGGTVTNFGSETFTAKTSIASSSFALIPQSGRLFLNTDEGTGSITDNDSALVMLSVLAPDASAAEPMPVNNGQFRISQTNPSSSNTVIQFNIATGGTNAIQGLDYDLFVGTTKLTNTVTILAGQTEVLINVVVLPDSLLEVDEFVRLSMNSFISRDPNVDFPVGPQPESVVQIDDNDTAFLTVAKTIDGSEGVGGPATPGLFTVSLTQASASDTVIRYRVLDPSVPADVTLGAQSPFATPNFDYTALYTGATGTVTITAGQTTTTILVDVIDDFVANEGIEKVTIRLESFIGNPDIDITVGPRVATVDILEDADGLFVRVDTTKSKNGTEPGLSNQDAEFTLQVVDANNNPVVIPVGSTTTKGITVNLVYGGDALQTVDYNAPTTLFIPEGTSSLAITIDIGNDFIAELTESVTITVQSILAPGLDKTGEPIAPHPTQNTGTVTITDDDGLGAAKIQSIAVNNGQAQRSEIRSLTVVLNQVVNAPSAGFIVRKRDDLAGGLLYTGTVAGVIATPNYVSLPGQTVVTLTFAPNSTFVNAAGTLVDGNYEVELIASLITTQIGGFQMDGDGNGTGGDNHRFGDDAMERFYRLYGDADGDGDVDPTDIFNFFVPALSTPSANLWLDGDLDGDVDPTDIFNFAVPRLITLRDINGFPN